MNTTAQSNEQQKMRQSVLSVLSLSHSQDLQNAWEKLAIKPNYTLLKQPEIGMVMVKAKTGGNGTPFNMGEMTVTRTVLQLNSNEVGYGYTAGRDKEKALTIALIDACYQVPQWQPLIEEIIVTPLKNKVVNQQQQHKAKVDNTKVNFFTMVRGE